MIEESAPPDCKRREEPIVEALLTLFSGLFAGAVFVSRRARSFLEGLCLSRKLSEVTLIFF